MHFAQRTHYPQNLVVRLALGQRNRQGVIQRLGLEKQPPVDTAVACGIQFEPLCHVCPLHCCQRVQRAADLARITCYLGHAFFVTIEFLQHNHGQENIMFFKPKQAHGVVHEHIGVENKKFGRSCWLGFFLLGRCWQLGGSLNRCLLFV